MNSSHRIHTQVGIVGAGPAGLMLGHLLHRAGIDSFIVENRSREFTSSNGCVRACWSSRRVELMNDVGLGERLAREGGGRAITVYGQNEVVKDLVAARIPCDFVAGCDGFHGISRTSIPRGQLRLYERQYPFAWLGILANAVAGAKGLNLALADVCRLAEALVAFYASGEESRLRQQQPLRLPAPACPIWSISSAHGLQ